MKYLNKTEDYHSISNNGLGIEQRVFDSSDKNVDKKDSRANKQTSNDLDKHSPNGPTKTSNQSRYKKLIVHMNQLYPTVKWPLHKTWSFWYIKNDRSKKEWKDNLVKLIDVAYIEDFWSMYKHLVQPSALETNSDLALFRKGITPMWEDAENKDGGRWLLTFTVQTRKSNGLDEIWLNSILALIGDNFCHDSGVDESGSSKHLCDEINGICVQNRPKVDKLSLWTKDYKDKNAIKLIGFVF